MKKSVKTLVGEKVFSQAENYLRLLIWEAVHQNKLPPDQIIALCIFNDPMWHPILSFLGKVNKEADKDELSSGYKTVATWQFFEEHFKQVPKLYKLATIKRTKKSRKDTVCAIFIKDQSFSARELVPLPPSHLN